MIPETVLLLKQWEERAYLYWLARQGARSGVLPKATAYRATDIVTRVFAPRYLRDGGEPAKWLKRWSSTGWQGDKLSQLLLIYTARANLILRDFINEVYWPHYRAGAHLIHRQEGVNFLKSAQRRRQVSQSMV